MNAGLPFVIADGIVGMLAADRDACGWLQRLVDLRANENAGTVADDPFPDIAETVND